MRLTHDQIIAAIHENSENATEVVNPVVAILDDSEDFQERIEMLAGPVAHHILKEIVNREIHDLLSPDHARYLRHETMVWVCDRVIVEIREELRQQFLNQGIITRDEQALNNLTN